MDDEIDGCSTITSEVAGVSVDEFADEGTAISNVLDTSGGVELLLGLGLRLRLGLGLGFDEIPVDNNEEEAAAPVSEVVESL